MFLSGFAVALALQWLPCVFAATPNIVFILTDDQDLHMNSMDYQPTVQRELLGKGTFYSKHYCSVAVCCPSRVSLLTGKQTHNTNVTSVTTPYGGYPKIISQGVMNNWLPVWLQDAGYNSYYAGKLFNLFNVDNYNKPYPRGWTQNRYFLDPWTYKYFDPRIQKNKDPPVEYPDAYSTDLLSDQSIELLDEAKAAGKPFYLQIAPTAPHVDGGIARPPPRYENLFPDAVVPRTPNFNPDFPSGEAWVKTLPKQSQAEVDYHDEMYRDRLRCLRAVDDLVENVINHLDTIGLLDNTYIVYTTDNGYHIGQHRMVPGKSCGYEEDINIPFIVRGPGVSAGRTTDIISTHVDWAPTVMKLFGLAPRPDFDGAPIPVLTGELNAAESATVQTEHINVEYWGRPQSEGPYNYTFNTPTSDTVFNTYKALRIIGRTYSFYYSIWCSGQHELYDMLKDPGQLNNLYNQNNVRTAGRTVANVKARLDALVLILKSCKGNACRGPWGQIHRAGAVHSLADALNPKYDHFYQVEQTKVKYNKCEHGYIISSEGPQWPKDGLVFKGTKKATTTTKKPTSTRKPNNLVAQSQSQSQTQSTSPLQNTTPSQQVVRISPNAQQTNAQQTGAANPTTPTGNAGNPVPT